MLLLYNLIVIAVLLLVVLAIASATSRPPPLGDTAVRLHSSDQPAPIEPAPNLIRAAGWQ